MRNKSSGFSVVELLILVTILGLAGFAGWSATQKSKSKNNETSYQADQSIQKEMEEYKRSTSIPKEWKNYTLEEYRISFSHPDSWRIVTSSYEKEIGEETQNVYSRDATKIFVICLQEKSLLQNCNDQININNQEFPKSVAQMKEYYDSYVAGYSQRDIVIDGHPAVEFTEPSSGSFAGKKTYLVSANGHTYHLTEVSSIDRTPPQNLSAAESLALFESIQIN